jgi:hypothetical protein
VISVPREDVFLEDCAEDCRQVERRHGGHSRPNRNHLR